MVGVAESNCISLAHAGCPRPTQTVASRRVRTPLAEMGEAVPVRRSAGVPAAAELARACSDIANRHGFTVCRCYPASRRRSPGWKSLSWAGGRLGAQPEIVLIRECLGERNVPRLCEPSSAVACQARHARLPPVRATELMPLWTVRFRAPTSSNCQSAGLDQVIHVRLMRVPAEVLDRIVPLVPVAMASLETGWAGANEGFKYETMHFSSE